MATLRQSHGDVVSGHTHTHQGNTVSFVQPGKQTTVCPGKKETSMFSAISSIKLGWFWWNLSYCFLNKFASKLCKRLPPHLNNVSTLPCEIRNIYVLPSSCWRENSIISSTATMPLITMPQWRRYPSYTSLHSQSLFHFIQKKWLQYIWDFRWHFVTFFTLRAKTDGSM